MSIFNPSGNLNISADPSDLPDNALTRCKNLRRDSPGILQTRKGSNKLNVTAIDTAIHLIVEQSGNRYTFAGENIYKNETSIASGLTSAQWSAVLYNAFNDTTQQIYALNGTDRKRIQDDDVFEWGIAAPSSAITTGVGSGTGLTGDYNAKYTYARKVGSTVVSESDPSDAGTTRTLANQSLNVTVTASSDPQVTHIRFYRTLAGGSVYYHDSDWPNQTGTNTLNTADSSLGSLLETDHDRPPLGSFVIGPVFGGLILMIKDNNLYYCKSKQPEYWPTTNFIEVSNPQFPGKMLVLHNGLVYYLTSRDIYLIQGTTGTTFFPYKLSASTGCPNHQSAVSVQGKGLYHVGRDGIYLFSDRDKKISEGILDPIFNGETTNGMNGLSGIENSFLFRFGSYLYFGYTSAGFTYPTNVIVLNIETDDIAYYVYNDGSNVEIRAIAEDRVNSKLLIGDNTGYVRQIENQAALTDSGTAIDWEAQSKDFTLQTRKHFPRWAKYDVDVISGSCTGALILDGDVHQSHSITGSRNTKRRLVKEGNGDREAIRVSGSGQTKIYLVETE